MEISKLAMFFVLNGEEYTGPPPSGAPTSLVVTTYGGPVKARLSWSNTDSTAYTRIYYGSGGCPIATPVMLDAVGPGITSYDSLIEMTVPADADDISFVVRHYKNGQESGSSNCLSIDSDSIVPE